MTYPRSVRPMIALFLVCGAYWLSSSYKEGSSHEDIHPGQATPFGSLPGVRAKELQASRQDPLRAHMSAIRGKVLTPEGDPIGNAQVCAFARSPELLQHEQHTPFCTTSGDDGAYRVEGLSPVGHRLYASAPTYIPGHHEHGEGRHRRQNVSLAPGRERRDVDIVLKPGGVKIRGVVRDISGGVLEDAIVRESGVATRTDENGHFSLWVAPGTTSVHAQAEGYALHESRGSAPGHFFELLLTPESVLVGKVVIANTSTPVAGIRVELHAWGARASPDQSGGPAAITDAQGSFRIDRLHPGTYKPSAFDEQHFGVAAAQVPLGLGQTSDPVMIEVHPALAITGAITPDDGEACDRGYVSLHDSTTKREFSASTHRDGSIRLQGVLPGTYTVGVYCENYLPAEHYDPLVVEGSLEGLEWPVHRGQSIHGQVIDADGAPIENIVAIAAMKTDPGAPRAYSVQSMSEKSREDGTFAIFGLKPGTYEVRLGGERPGPEEPTEVLVAEGSDVDDLKLALPPAGSVTGRVVDPNGEPFANARVTLQGEKRGPAFLLFDEAPTGRTADDGTFTIEHVRPGVYRAAASLSWSGSLRAPGLDDDDDQSVELEVGGGETTTIEIRVEAKGEAIRGQVVDADGEPVTDAFVTVARESEGSAKVVGRSRSIARWRGRERQPILTDQDGNFVLQDLMAGTYTIFVRRKSGGEGYAEGVVTGGEVLITLQETGSLTGTVVSARGGPPDEFSVSLRDRESGLFRRDLFFRTGGEFSFDALPAGTYEVIVSGGGDAETKVVLGEGEEKRDLKLDLAAQVTVHGRLVDLDTGEPVAGMVVDLGKRGGGVILGQKGGQRGRVSDENGEFTLDNAPSGSTVHLTIHPANWLGTSDYDVTSVSHTVSENPSVQDLGTVKLAKKRVSRPAITTSR